MATTLKRLFFAFPLLLATACASAADRFNDGLELQAQGRYMEAAYRYADAVEKDSSLQEARDRLLIVGDSAIMVARGRGRSSRRPGGARCGCPPVPVHRSAHVACTLGRDAAPGARRLPGSTPDGLRRGHRLVHGRGRGRFARGTMGGRHSSVCFRAGRLLADAGPEGGLSRRPDTRHHRLGRNRAGGP